MGMREMVILILGLVVVAVILRGLYLAIQARRGQIRLAIERNIPQDIDLEQLELSELPSGGARIVQRSLEEVNRQNSTQDELDLGGEATQSGPIPILMDTVEVKETTESHTEDKPNRHDVIDENNPDVSQTASELSESSEAESDSIFAAELSQVEQYDEESAAYNELTEESTNSPEPDSGFDFGDDDIGRSEPTLGFDKSFEEEFGDHPITADERIGDSETVSKSDIGTEQKITQEPYSDGVGEVTNINQAKESRKPATASDIKTAKPIEPAEVLVVNVMSREGEMFYGPELLQALITTGLKHGDMDIFHKHSGHSSEDPIVFSVANILNPGTFDLDNMAGFTTRGVSLFLSLPAAVGNLQAFEQMLKTAQQIRGAVDGELKDDHRNVMTAQTIEHYRQRIHDFELLKLKSTQARF